MGGLGFTDPVVTSSSEYEASIKVTNPLVRRIVEQEHQPPLRCLRNSNNATEHTKTSKWRIPCRQKLSDCVELATGRTNWLTVISLKELDYKLNKKEFRDASKLRYDWEITDTPGAHNELRDLEAEMLRMVCNDVEVEPVLPEVTGETLSHGANKVPDARLDIHAPGFWEWHWAALFDVRVCHRNANSYRDLTPKQIYKRHENEKKRQYAERVMEIEQGTFTPLVFTTTGGMADECVKYHSRLAELIAQFTG